MRSFQKISFEQFKKDIIDDKELYQNYQLPKRATRYSAGYDISSLKDYVIKKGESIKIPTGLKAEMNDDEVLLLIVRSSLGFKHNIRMCNQIGVIDKDYYNNESNEGHIFIKLQNEGEEDFVIKKYDRLVQGIFIKYLTTDLDSDDEENLEKTRTGGIGSTTL